MTRFLVQPDRPRRPEIELKRLALPSWKLSSEDLLCVYGNWAQSTRFQFNPHLTRIFFLVLPSPKNPWTNQIQNKSNPFSIKIYASPEAFAAWVWSDRRLGCWVFASLRRRDTFDLCVLHCLKLSLPGLLGFCIVAAARHVRSLRFASPEAFAA